MTRPRFTIANLVILIVFVAVAVAGLRAADDAWDSGLFGVTLLTLLSAVLLAVHRTERRRAFWIGFALFGWGYLVASLITPIESRLPTTMGLAYLDSKLAVRQTTYTVSLALNNSINSNVPQKVVLMTQGKTLLQHWSVAAGKMLVGPNGTTEDFVRIGQSLLAIIMAFVGGQLSRYLYDKAPRRVDDASEVSEAIRA